MKIREILTELRNNPERYRLEYCDNTVCELSSDRLGLYVHLTRAIGHKSDTSTVFIEFSIHGQYGITGTGNAVKILSTVFAMIKDALHKFITNNDDFVEFGSEVSEPSRVKLYKRIAPVISDILGSDWKRSDRGTIGTLYVFSWERNKKKLNEKPVESAWITDLTYNRPNRVLTMRLSNGRAFSIPGITRAGFERWTNSPSKGRYFHDNIKDRYKIARIN